MACVQVERTNGRKEKVVFAWGNLANGRLGGTDPLKHKVHSTTQPGSLDHQSKGGGSLKMTSMSRCRALSLWYYLFIYIYI